MKRILLVLAVAAVMAVTAAPAFAQPLQFDDNGLGDTNYGGDYGMGYDPIIWPGFYNEDVSDAYQDYLKEVYENYYG